jgi:hypothetical protein
MGGAPITATEGSIISLSASATDPSAPDVAAGFTYAWTVTRTKNGTTSAYATGAGPSFAFTADDDGAYAVTLTATDKDGGSGSTSATVNVTNVAPIVTLGTPAAGAVYTVNTAVTLTGTFSDPGSADRHGAVWTITGPGQAPITVAGTIAANGRVTASYIFTAAGTYQVSLTVTDSDGAPGSATAVAAVQAAAVVGDDCGAEVTGGGWFDSPCGASAADPTFAGKANLGFNAQHKKGRSTPTGQLQFNAGKLNFHSTAYESLVITGSRAQLKGTGTVNGRGTYAFVLTVTGGGRAGVPDRVRIRIWNPATGAAVYDNLTGAPDTADPVAPLRGGNVTIHTPKQSDCGCGHDDDDHDDDHGHGEDDDKCDDDGGGRKAGSKS